MSTCRSCAARLEEPFLALGPIPISNAFLRAEQLDLPEPFYPLDVRFCAACGLVQIDDVPIEGSLFDGDYVYFSSFSQSWLAHCRAYTDAIVSRLGLGAAQFVVEIASNDGYLLQYFGARGVPVLGVEPTANTAAAAVARGVPTEVAFFGADYAKQLVAGRGRADLVIANNVLAHVPQLNDFVSGLAELLAPAGTITIEFPHLLELVRQRQFDTIYHEHYSYFSLLAATALFERHGLSVYDVDELPTHGGSLRLYVGHRGVHALRSAVGAVIARERAEGLHEAARYRQFASEVAALRDELVAFFARTRAAGQTIVGYGAPAKGNTLLNYCGIGRAELPFTVDKSPHKQGRFLPGTHIPVLAPEAIADAKPALVLILPWNLKAEIMEDLAQIRAWGGEFVIPIPRLEVLK